MSTVLEQSPVEDLSSPRENPYRFSVDDFYRMVDLDFFPDEARVGLWEGQVYEEMAKKHPHSFSWAALNAAVTPILPPGWSIWAECTITLSPDKAPLPDLLVLRGNVRDLRDRRPSAADVGLLVEVADGSLKIDTGAKLAAYARAAIPVYWVVNLKDGVIQVYESPVPEEGRFASVARYGPGDLVPLKLDGTQVAMIAASDIL
jgi:Uma2 family endonuclease